MRLLPFTAILLASSSALASPPYPFDSLLARAQIVFVGDLTAHDGSTVRFSASQVLRGKAPSPLRLELESRNGGLPDGVTRYVVISQGGDQHCQVTDKATVGQRMEGQAGFCGWILFPVLSNDEVSNAFRFDERKDQKDLFQKIFLDEVPAIVAHAPFHPPSP